MGKLIAGVEALIAVVFAAIITGTLFVFSVFGGLITAICALMAACAGIVILIGMGIYEAITGDSKNSDEDGFV
jgi:hypothetical protein